MTQTRGSLEQVLPRPVRVVLGLVLLGVGLHLITRPLTSLHALAIYLGAVALAVGVTELWSLEQEGRRPLAGTLTGAIWLVLGVAALVLPTRALDMLAVLVGVALVVSGLLRAARARTGPVEERLAHLLLGVAELILGVVALAWPDLTLIAVAAIFGIRVVLLGARLVWDAVAPPVRPSPPTTKPTWRRWGRVLVAAVALVASVGLYAVSSGARDAAPSLDSFYATPADVPDEPGRLLRSEPFTAEVPDGARAWRILYTTTNEDGSPTVASGLVLVPEQKPDGDAGFPVISWTHGTTGYARACAPSNLPDPFTAGAFPDVLPQVVDRGWAVVATDYVGLGAAGSHPYLVGRVSAQAALDAVRAAHELDDARLGDATVAWGHSQGGAAALWTSAVQPEYAPDVDLRGTVAMAPAADLISLARHLGEVPGGAVFAAFLLEGYRHAYDDIVLDDVVRPGFASVVSTIAGRCLSEPGVFASVLTALSLSNDNPLRGDPADGAFGAHLYANTPTATGPGPVLIAQGAADTLIVPQVQERFARRLHQTGNPVTYRPFPGLEHLSLVQEGSPLLKQLLTWTEKRFRR